jgi:hypothetical protein
MEKANNKRKVIASTDAAETVKIRENDWNGDPLPVNWVQILPSQSIVVRSVSPGRIINLFLDSPFSIADIRLIQSKLRTGSKIFVTKEDGRVFFYENTENESEDDLPF